VTLLFIQPLLLLAAPTPNSHQEAVEKASYKYLFKTCHISPQGQFRSRALDMSILTYTESDIDRMDADKPLVWMEGEIKTPPFSSRARVEAGCLLRLLQQGKNLGMPVSRSLPSIGHRCYELRINDEGKAWRIFYHLAPDAVVVLEVLNKKTRKTPLSTLRNCERRLNIYQSNR
jgi:phage-related protein